MKLGLTRRNDKTRKKNGDYENKKRKTGDSKSDESGGGLIKIEYSKLSSNFQNVRLSKFFTWVHKVENL